MKPTSVTTAGRVAADKDRCRDAPRPTGDARNHRCIPAKSSNVQGAHTKPVQAQCKQAEMARSKSVPGRKPAEKDQRRSVPGHSKPADTRKPAGQEQALRCKGPKDCRKHRDRRFENQQPAQTTAKAKRNRPTE